MCCCTSQRLKMSCWISCEPYGFAYFMREVEMGGEGREMGGEGREMGGEGREMGGEGREMGGEGREMGGRGDSREGKRREG